MGGLLLSMALLVNLKQLQPPIFFLVLVILLLKDGSTKHQHPLRILPL